MNAYLLPGMVGLLLGLTLGWTGFSRPAALQDALALRRSCALRSGLYVLGFSMLLTALLCWLAVIDVDEIVVLPLSAGALIGGALFGVAAGLSGYTPLTAFAGLGGGAAVEALCTMAGCFAATLVLPLLDAPMAELRSLPPLSDTTLFRMTLDEPYLLGGGFLGQGCAGLLLMAIAACIPSPKVSHAPVRPEEPAGAEDSPAPAESAASAGDAEPAEAAAPAEAELPEPAEEEPTEAADPAEPDAPAIPLLPAAAPEETFIALLPGEEPLVVDTQMDEEDAEEEQEDGGMSPS